MASILTDEKLINDLKDVNIDICTVSWFSSRSNCLVI